MPRRAKILTEVKPADVRRRIINLLVGLGALLLTEVGREVYRPFIYARNLYDFHIADTLGNSIGTVTTVFVMLAIFGRDRKFDDGVILCATLGVVLYEIAHPLLGRPIDPWDVSATVVAGALSWALYRSLHRIGDTSGGVLKHQGH
jgi:hypothetical protein